jgi:hypothetical protein
MQGYRRHEGKSAGGKRMQVKGLREDERDLK